MYLPSGYKTITGVQFLNALALLEERRITFRCFRIYLASFSLVAIREAAKRVRQKKNLRGEENVARYRVCELARLCAVTERQARRELNVLGREGLLSFSETEISTSREAIPEAAELLALVRSPTRPVPVPRGVLRFLAGEKRKSVSKAMIAYMLRGLTLARSKGEISGKGSAKLSWIADVAGLSERGARYARKELIRLGWISGDEGSKQWKLNRHGAYFSINLAWAPEALNRKGRDFAPLCPGKRPSFAPPNKDRKTPYGSKNQKTLKAGFSEKEEGEGEGAPCIKNVQSEDLFSLSRCEELYWQAVELRLIPHSDHAALCFLSAAVRARSVRAGDPARIFVSIIRRHLWTHVTFAQEEVARRGLQKARDQNPSAFRSRPDHGAICRREAA